MRRWGHDEYLVRLRWLDRQWLKPDRRSHELARIAQRVIQMALKAEHRQSVKLEDQLVGFRLVTPGAKPEDKPLPELKLMELPSDHPLTLQAKARWGVFMAAGAAKEKRKRGR